MRSAAILLTTCLFSSVAFANDNMHARNHMTPLDSEALVDPISLHGQCSEVKIVEWRPTPGFEKTTSASKRSEAILNEVCELVSRNFPKFVALENYNVDVDRKFTQSISLIPADLQNHGSDIRNLNDSKYRFYGRSGEYDENGDIIPIWGYHQRAISFIFIRNDAFNPEFKTIFAHELFHAMSYQFGVFNQHDGDKTEADEKMARRFTRFLGMGE